MTTTPPAAIGGDELAKALRDAWGQGRQYGRAQAFPEQAEITDAKRDAWIRQYMARLTPAAGEPDREGDGAEGILWCMHVAGPDDVHAAPDFWTGLAWAAELNAFVAARAGKEEWAADENWPLIQATVQRWTGSAERHATSLARELSERREHTERRAKTAADPLTAAAPDMLAALKGLVENPAFELGAPVVDGVGNTRRRRAAVGAWDGFVEAARAAIAKAEARVA